MVAHEDKKKDKENRRACLPIIDFCYLLLLSLNHLLVESCYDTLNERENDIFMI